MMYSQGLRLFQNRGLHLLLTRPAVAFTQQSTQAFSVYNFESVITIFNFELHLS